MSIVKLGINPKYKLMQHVVNKALFISPTHVMQHLDMVSGEVKHDVHFTVNFTMMVVGQIPLFWLEREFKLVDDSQLPFVCPSESDRVFAEAHDVQDRKYSFRGEFAGVPYEDILTGVGEGVKVA